MRNLIYFYILKQTKMKNTFKLKTQITTSNEIETEITFPIYLKSCATYMIAIYSPEIVYQVTDDQILQQTHSLNDELGYWFTRGHVVATQEEFMALVMKAKAYQTQKFTDIVWRESMEQNPAMADMTVKDYSPERLEEMNYDVRDADEAERMERNAEIED